MKETKGQNVQKLKQKNNLKDGRNNSNCSRGHNRTKLLVPRNGTNVKESKKVEKRGNLLYNIIM